MKSGEVGFSENILIAGGRVVDPSQGIDALMDVLVRDGRIADVAAPGSLKNSASHTIKARGLIVAPGLIDLHVHLREPGQSHKETIASGTAAAATGGFTSVCTMPNTAPVNDSAEVTQWMQNPERGAKVNVFPVAAATIGSLGQQLSDYKALQSAGAVGVSDDGKPILEDDVMRQVLAAALKLGLPVIQHAEDTRMTAGRPMNEGPMSFRLGLRGQPTEAEARIVRRDIDLAAQTGAHLHIAHISAAASLAAVRDAKSRNVHVTCEVTPHHFLFTEEEVAGYDTRFKMNPPLRSNSDREAMVAGLLDGTIDAIATDHAPHAYYEKEVEFDRAAFGITGLEVALGIAISYLHRQKGMPLSTVIALLSTKPASIISQSLRGTLAKGAHADITLFDPKKQWTYNVSKTRSLSKNCPYDGMKMYGKVTHTMVGGRIVHEG